MALSRLKGLCGAMQGLRGQEEGALVVSEALWLLNGKQGEDEEPRHRIHL